MRTFLVFVFSLAGFSFLAAQQSEAQQATMRVMETSQVMSRGLKSNLSIFLRDADKKMVDRLWGNYTRNRFGSRAKYDRKTKEFVAEEAKVRAVSSYPVNLVSQSSQVGNNVRLSVWIDMQGAYLSSNVNPRSTLDAYSILQDFALEVEREKIRLRVKEEDRTLQKMQNELRLLKNAHTRYHKEIEFAEARIKKAKENIIKNEKDQIRAAERIEKQREALAQVKKLLEEL